MLIVFDDMIADMEANRRKSYNHWIVSKRKKTQLVFVSQSYLKVPETTRLNATHYFIMKIPTKEYSTFGSELKNQIDIEKKKTTISWIKQGL